MQLAALSAGRVLAAWEQGQGKPPQQQAVTILACAAGVAAAELSGLTVGQRDALLLGLRAMTFGPTISLRSPCPRCGQGVRFAVDVADIEASATDEDTDGVRELREAGWEIAFRLPTLADLRAAEQTRDLAAARAMLLRRCVLSAVQDGTPADPATLPEALVEALSARIEAWDPLVETALAVACEQCRHRWNAMLEVGTLLYAEIEDSATRLLREVDELARRYGWREQDILAMSAARRTAYLTLS